MRYSACGTLRVSPWCPPATPCISLPMLRKGLETFQPKIGKLQIRNVTTKTHGESLHARSARQNRVAGPMPDHQRQGKDQRDDAEVFPRRGQSARDGQKTQRGLARPAPPDMRGEQRQAQPEEQRRVLLHIVRHLEKILLEGHRQARSPADQQPVIPPRDQRQRHDAARRERRRDPAARLHDGLRLVRDEGEPRDVLRGRSSSSG